MRHRLVKVSNAAGVVAQYSYDASNLRIKKETATEIIHYSYNQQGQLLSETDDAGNPIRDYIYFNNAPIAVIKYGVSPNIYYYIVNHQGTPRRVVDFFGTVVWKSTYLPSGAINTPDIETVVNNFRFPGQYYDKETGLHYNWNRYYDPETGRYISPDPIGLAGGNSLYGYAGADSVNAVDPEGLAFGYNWGESYGDYATQYWADKQLRTGNPLYAIPGSFAALWTYETSTETFLTLSGEGVFVVGARIAKAIRLVKVSKRGFFPKNADDLLSEIPRNKKGHIFPSDKVRIRTEQHPLKLGETYSPRHHGQHYHVEIRKDVNKSWNNKKNVIKVKPNNYIPGEGTGFLPGEKYPGL